MNPVSYTSSSQAGGQRQRSSTISEFASTQSAYKPASALSELPYEPESRRPSHSVNKAGPLGVVQTSSTPSHDRYSVMESSSQSSNGSQGVWPSPPLAPNDLDMHYCIQEPSNSMDGPKTDYTYTPASPNGWYSADHDVYSIPSQCHSEKSSGYCPLSHPVDTPSSSGDVALDSTDGYFLSFHGEKGSIPGYILGVDFIHPSSRLEASPLSWSDSVADSPVSVDTPKDAQAGQFAEARSVPASLSRSAATSISASPPSEANVDLNEQVDGDKSDEPYAKLIYKAFMSRPDYSMTLQEIYQWFRENTMKAVTETGGWQNSIRHNLSMNAAFRKKDKPRCKTSKDSASSEDSKRVNEWVLEEWAVCNGVQSTTRYRKSNYARRAASGRTAAATTNPWAPEHSAKRAMSGRKGGCATRASRQRRRNIGHVLSWDGTSQQWFDGRRASASLSAPTDMYGYGYSGAQLDTMHYLALQHAYHEGLTGRCGDEVTAESNFHEQSTTNFPQETSNSSNLHHAQHTVGTYHGLASMDMKLGSESEKRSCVRYRDPVVCTSTSTSPSISRPFDTPGTGPHAWWQDGQYL